MGHCVDPGRIGISRAGCIAPPLMSLAIPVYSLLGSWEVIQEGEGADCSIGIIYIGTGWVGCVSPPKQWLRSLAILVYSLLDRW